ncbi:unnamed protein product [Moneuplotes crassus]|uniref:Uncharacterized protein n=1 Tax=Euplotes crassus TaxID=5936 RepID=A0AAD1XFK9_EUPCR|nr:unnamed protein product [Moneuplotes crassus]
MSEAYNFLFSRCHVAHERILKLHQFRERAKPNLKAEDEESFVVNPLQCRPDVRLMEQRRRMSTKSEENHDIPIDFSFQEDLPGNESDLYQEKFYDANIANAIWKDDLDDGFLTDNLHDQKFELHECHEDRGVTNTCIVLEDQNNFENVKDIQDENFLDDKNYNYKNLELELASFHQSFDTFAMPEIKDNLVAVKDLTVFGKVVSTKEDEPAPQANVNPIVKSSKGRGIKRKTKTNSFALGRTCFRGMSNYFKNKFEPFLKQWEKDFSNTERKSMDKLIKDFIQIEFTDCQHCVDSDEFLNSMVTILHSQNYKKPDDYIKRRDFRKIRSLLYCFSSSAKKNFISDKTYAIIFQNFFVKARDEFLGSKAKAKNPAFRDELSQELEDIYYLSLETLKESQ